MNNISSAPTGAAMTSPGALWDKGSAPADWFAALSKEVDAIQADVFDKLNGKGNGPADPKTIQAVQGEFEHLRGELIQSKPQYQPVDPYIKELLGTCPRMYGWSISYHAGAQSGSNLITYNNEVNVQHNFFEHADYDHEGARIAGLAEEAQNIEHYVLDSLQDPRPFQNQTGGGIFHKRPKNEILQEMFSADGNGLKTGIDTVAADAETVCEQGFYVSKSVNCRDPNARC